MVSPGSTNFLFLSKVLQTFETPFAYALLLYPKQVDARQVRQSMRIVTSMPAQLRVPGQSAVLAQEATLIDISTADAMVRTSTCYGPSTGHLVGMAFTGLARQDKLMLHYITRIASGLRRCIAIIFSI